MKSARQSAFEILNKIQRNNSYSNLTLDAFLEKSPSEQQDKKFISALVYGVTERLLTLDYNLSLYLSQPLKKLKPEVLTALRMGAYQILFMERVPTSAAVNESVKLVKSNKAAFASGLVNAVLRKISLNGLKDDGGMSVKYSAPEWLCKLWCESYGQENAEKLLEASFGSTETDLSVNTLKITADELCEELMREGFCCQKSKLAENSLIAEGSGAIHKTDCFKKGYFHVQDISSKLCCEAVSPDKDDTVLDICAAPGGKSFTLAQLMNNSGNLISCDVYEHRLKLIKDGAERLGITNIKALVNDGSKFNPDLPQADKILCDVPCSGLGVIRKKPEIRYKKAEEVDNLSDLQYSILCTSSRYLKVGGTLIYSTCSLNPNENEKIVEKFLNEHPNFESIRVLGNIKRYGDDTDYLTLMPHIHGCDGFFVSGIRRIEV